MTNNGKGGGGNRGRATRSQRLTHSQRLYALLLAAYPSEFRREYGREMRVVFADRCRDGASDGGGGVGRGTLLRVWCETLVDLAVSAPRQHLDSISEGGGLMKTLRTVVVAALAYAFALLVVAPLYVRNRESMPGFVNSLIDALIATGVIFNFIFLVLTLTGLMRGVRAVRAALALTGLLVAALITAMMLSGGPPAYANLSIVVAQVISLLVWFSIHLWWVLRRRPAEPPAAA